MVCILSKSTKMWFVKGLQTVTLSTLMTLLLVHCRSKADFLFYNIQIQKMGNNSITTTLLPYFFVCSCRQLFFFPCNNSQIMLNWHNELYSKSVWIETFRCSFYYINFCISIYIYWKVKRLVVKLFRWETCR